MIVAQLNQCVADPDFFPIRIMDQGHLRFRVSRKGFPDRLIRIYFSDQSLDQEPNPFYLDAYLFYDAFFLLDSISF